MIMPPPELEATIAPLVRRPNDVTPEEAARFVTVPAEEFARPFDFKGDVSHFRWALATAESYRRIGLSLLARERPDLLMVYIEGVDSTSHLFGHLFRAERLGGELAAQQARYGRAVDGMYVYADGIVGEFLAQVDTDTTMVVLSDHGFQLGVLQDDPSKTRDMRRVSERFHRMDGVLYLYGRGVRPGARIGGRSGRIFPRVNGKPRCEIRLFWVVGCLLFSFQIPRPPLSKACLPVGRGGEGGLVYECSSFLHSHLVSKSTRFV